MPLILDTTDDMLMMFPDLRLNIWVHEYRKRNSDIQELTFNIKIRIKILRKISALIFSAVGKDFKMAAMLRTPKPPAVFY